MPTSKVVGIDHISIRVSNYVKSRAFYSKLFTFLGFEIAPMSMPCRPFWRRRK